MLDLDIGPFTFQVIYTLDMLKVARQNVEWAKNDMDAVFARLKEKAK